MKREMDLIREMLLRVEEDPRFDGSHYVTFTPEDFPEHTQAEIAYHVDLLFEARLVEGIATLDPDPAILKLTWDGHEFVDNIRDPSVWSGVKEKIKSVKSVALGVVVQVATAEIKKRLGLP